MIKLSAKTDIFNVRDSQKETFNEGFADDIKILIEGSKDRRAVMLEIADGAMSTVTSWCEKNSMKLNTDKTVAVHFTKSRTKAGDLRPIKANGAEIKWAESTRYLGVQIDSRLNWREQMKSIVNKGMSAIFAVKKAIGKDWGMSPKMMDYVYKSIIIPRMSTGVISWNRALDIDKNKKALDKIHRQVMLLITGAKKTTPTMALNELLDLNPLHLELKKKAIMGCSRLKAQGKWFQGYGNSGHTNIGMETLKYGECDFAPNTKSTGKNFTVTIDPWRELIDFENGQDQSLHIWCADGAVGNSGAGIGFVQTQFLLPHKEWSMTISASSTPSQAEAIAIAECAKRCMTEEQEGVELIICSDSQSTLMEIERNKTDKKSISECWQALNQLGARNPLKLVWVRRNSGVGIGKADALAKKAASEINENVSVPLSLKRFKEKVETKFNEDRKKEWERMCQVRKSHSHEFIRGMNKQRAKILLGLKREDLRNYVSCMTGHGKDRQSLSYIFEIASTSCRLCGVGVENMRHLMLECGALKGERKSYLGAETLEVADFHNFHPRWVTKLIKNSKLQELVDDSSLLTRKTYISTKRNRAVDTSDELRFNPPAKQAKVTDFFRGNKGSAAMCGNKIKERERIARCKEKLQRFNFEHGLKNKGQHNDIASSQAQADREVAERCAMKLARFIYSPSTSAGLSTDNVNPAEPSGSYATSLKRKRDSEAFSDLRQDEIKTRRTTVESKLRKYEFDESEDTSNVRHQQCNANPDPQLTQPGVLDKQKTAQQVKVRNRSMTVEQRLKKFEYEEARENHEDFESRYATALKAPLTRKRDRDRGRDDQLDKNENTEKKTKRNS